MFVRPVCDEMVGMVHVGITEKISFCNDFLSLPEFLTSYFVALVASDGKQQAFRTFCWIGSFAQAHLLLCDAMGPGCKIATHLECCQPPLAQVPQEDWFCVQCAPAKVKGTGASPVKWLFKFKRKLGPQEWF